MSRDVKNLAHSVYDRLRNRGHELSRPFDWILQNYANERFLYRLSKSKHCEKFVLKGGLVFVGWEIPLRRHTTDIDFRAFTRNDVDNIMSIVKDVCSEIVKDDGIQFDINTITADVITEQAEYPGVRVRFLGRLGEMTKIQMQLDMGFLDEITPQPLLIHYPTLLDMPAPELRGYPKETVVAEKLHCLVFRGSINSRRKDFYDLWFISQQCDFEGNLLQDAIIQTFRTRDTEIPLELPVALSEEYAKENEHQWNRFLRTFNPENPDVKDFRRIIDVIREFLFPILQASALGKKFNLHWRSTAIQWEE